jgi:murein DD-endopeptidase MepM/ murein hydrolase activator NlpD
MHDAGWETQYSHLMNGSITVQKGQRVEAGAALGLIGFSGNSSFPHLDFSVRRDGNIVDPFGRGPSPACAASGERLWTAAAEKQLAYLPGAVLVTGFAAQIPERRAVRGGMHRARELSTLAPMLVFWVDMFGLAAGDIERFRILAPDGTVVAEREQRLDKAAHQHFNSIGRLRPDPGEWPRGTYRGEYLLFRTIDGERRPLLAAVREVTLR